MSIYVRLFKLLRFFAPYKLQVLRMFLSGFFFGAINSAIAAMTGVFVKLLGDEIPTARALDALLGAYAAHPLAAKFLQNYGDFFTKEHLFYVGVVIFCGLIVLMSVFIYFDGYFQFWTSSRVSIDMREAMVKKLLSMDLQFFRIKGANDVLARIGYIETVRGMLFQLFTLATRPIVILICLAYAISISWQLTLWAVVGTPLLAVLSKKMWKKLKATAMLVQQTSLNAGQRTLAIVYGIGLIKAFACEDFELKNFHRLNEENFRMMAKNARASCAERPMTSIFSKLGVLIVFIISGQMIMRGEMPPSELMSFLVVLSFMYSPAKEFSRARVAFFNALPNAERVFEVIESTNEVVDGAEILPDFHDAIEFKNVDFSYLENKPVIRDFSLRIARGKRIALVGVSGSGKTTILNLLLRLYDIDGGEISVDGKNLRALTFQSLRSQIGYVSQAAFLFNASIRENISYGQAEVSEEKVIAAAKTANLHEEILQTANGYDTVIGDGGVILSGGQQQRLCIARAVYKNAPILLLDEATSALDSENEKNVTEAIDRLMTGRTSITIAHRLATVKNSDEIVMMHEGRIIGQGAHAELLETCAPYARLVKLQSL